MKHKDILFTGGSGLLGKEMQKLFPDAQFPTRDELDIRQGWQVNQHIENSSLVVHMAAHTDTVGIETNPCDAIMNNIIGTSNIAATCQFHKKRLIYISTDYVFKGDHGNYKENDEVLPLNKYGWSKLGGECSVRMLHDSLIVRTSFCANEFPYDKAFTDQYTSRMKVSEFAPLLKELVESDLKGIIHVGAGRRSVYDLAKELSPEKDIKGCSINDMKGKGYTLPKDVSLDSAIFNSLRNR